MPQQSLEEIAIILAGKPKHALVRHWISCVLTDFLGASPSDLSFEKATIMVRGRMDALVGRTIFEFKSDLNRELESAKSQLKTYLSDRELESRSSFVGLATDGLSYRAFALQAGELLDLAEFTLDPGKIHDWLTWLDSVVMLEAEIPLEPDRVRKELGKGSITHARAIQTIGNLWRDVRGNPECKLKYDLWRDLLSVAYGTNVGDEDLFVQHTYLTVVAKTIANIMLLETLPREAKTILSGADLKSRGVFGPVEHDFFSWLLIRSEGEDLVLRIAQQVLRFKLDRIEADILKTLYESLIDPETRRILGEYYTPDWLAHQICASAIADPLKQSTLDPACGSGTFLFHAVRRVLATADAQGMAPDCAITLATEQVAGIDVHPVAVVFSSVTYLLALIEHIRRGRPKEIQIPVYMGDSLQWEVHTTMGQETIEIQVPEGPLLSFPSGVAKQPRLLDSIVQSMQDFGERDELRSHFEGWLETRGGISDSDFSALGDCYEALCQLRREGRNHIWSYVLRHLGRPLWLSQPEQKRDVILGNPPWLSYNSMPKENKVRFRAECERLGIWVGGNVSTSQDLSAYFYVRVAEKYLAPNGIIAMVMPFAAMTRGAYKKFLTGRFVLKSGQGVLIRYMDGWSFEHNLQPLFPLPACMLFAKEGSTGELPATIQAFSGQLPRRDASLQEAENSLTVTEKNWPGSQLLGQSDYRGQFKQGATLVPRRLVMVERIEPGRIGINPAAPLVRGRIGNQDKPPWKFITPPSGQVESQFLRPVYLGENVVPFRVMEPLLGVIPWGEERKTLLDSGQAGTQGHQHLSSWLTKVEKIWDSNKRSALTFTDQIDYFGKLSNQFPISCLRVVYGKAGAKVAAALLLDDYGIIDHNLYWASVKSEEEGHYLITVLNSQILLELITQFQTQGQWGARHFDKHIFKAPIPIFDPAEPLHLELAEMAATATEVALHIELKPGMYFTQARKRVRNALNAAGITREMEAGVKRLLHPRLATPLRKKRENSLISSAVSTKNILYG